MVWTKLHNNLCYGALFVYYWFKRSYYFFSFVPKFSRKCQKLVFFSHLLCVWSQGWRAVWPKSKQIELSRIDCYEACLLHKMASKFAVIEALKCGINAVGAQGRDCSSLLCHAHLKMGVLLHKQATVCSLMSMAVHTRTRQRQQKFITVSLLW